MILKALRRARLRHRIFFVALLLFVAGLFGAVGVTSAFFQAELDTKTATFAGGYLAVPTISAVYPSTAVSTIGGGNDGVLVWTNGTDQTTTVNEVQQIFGADQSTTNNCTGASYATTVLNSTTSPTTTQAFTFTDTNRATASGVSNGDWYCYEVVHGWPNTTAPTWTATATTNVQVGLAPTGVTFNNGRTAGTIDSGDTVAITFNQPVTGAGACTANNCSRVCWFRTTGTGADTLLLGDTTCTNSATDPYTVGKITGVTLGGATGHGTLNASIAVSGNTVTLTVHANGRTVAQVAGTTAFVSSTSILSANTTRQATACTDATSNCTLKSNTSPYSLSSNF